MRQVLPVASQGSLYVGNQSLVGWFARVTTSVPNLGALWTLGTVRYLSWILLAGLGVTLWRIRRYRPVVADEIAAAILVVLLGATLSWDHYFVWAFVPLTMMCDPRRWRAVSPSKCLAWAVMLTVAVGLFATAGPDPIGRRGAGRRLGSLVRKPVHRSRRSSSSRWRLVSSGRAAGARWRMSHRQTASASPASFDGPELSLSQR